MGSYYGEFHFRLVQSISEFHFWMAGSLQWRVSVITLLENITSESVSSKGVTLLVHITFKDSGCLLCWIPTWDKLTFDECPKNIMVRSIHDSHCRTICYDCSNGHREPDVFHHTPRKADALFPHFTPSENSQSLDVFPYRNMIVRDPTCTELFFRSLCPWSAVEKSRNFLAKHQILLCELKVQRMYPWKCTYTSSTGERITW